MNFCKDANIFSFHISSFNMWSLSTREFDENLLRKIFELSYEDEMSNLPSPPDVSNYLISEV